MAKRNRSDRRAAAAVELSVLLPFLLYLGVIATDWARLLYYTITIEACARAGALYAADESTRKQSPYASLQDHARAEAPGLNPAPTVTSQSITVNSRPGVRVTATVPFQTLTNFPGVPSSQTLARAVDMRMLPLTTQ